MHSHRYLLIFCCVLITQLFITFPAHAEKRVPLLYTALTATTPQIPLWAAANEGWPDGGSVAVEYWKTLDDLRAVMLAGKGDIWVGNLEGFAQAALRGAPVRLLAVTGWRKFWFVTPKDSPATDMETLAALLRDKNLPLSLAPQDSPALAILESVKQRGGPSFAVEAMPPQQLMLEMLRGERQYALLPEPFCSTLLSRVPGLHATIGLEAELARLYGGPARLPLAGVAVNAAFAEREPKAVRELAEALRRHANHLAELLMSEPEAAIAALPETVRKTLGEDVLRTSLQRDILLAVPAMEAKEEIVAFLRMILPQTDPTALDALVNGPFLFAAPELPGGPALTGDQAYSGK